MNNIEMARNSPCVEDYLLWKYESRCSICGYPFDKDFTMLCKIKKPCVADELGVSCDECPVLCECADDSLFPVHKECDKNIRKGLR